MVKKLLLVALFIFNVYGMSLNEKIESFGVRSLTEKECKMLNLDYAYSCTGSPSQIKTGFKELKNKKREKERIKRAKKWKGLSLNKSDIKLLNKYKITPKEYKNKFKKIYDGWVNERLTKQYSLLRKHKLNSVNALKKWLKKDQKKYASDLSYSNNKYINKLIKYKSAGFTNPDVINLFIRKSIDIKEAKKIVKLKLSDKQLKQALVFSKNHKQVMEITNLISKNCNDNVLELNILFKTNPYSAKNVCYQFVGKNTQVISEHDALYNYNNRDKVIYAQQFGVKVNLIDFYIYLKFPHQSAKMGKFMGIIKGVDVSELDNGNKIIVGEVVYDLER